MHEASKMLSSVSRSVVTPPLTRESSPVILPAQILPGLKIEDSSSSAGSPQPKEFLDSWKEISSFLKRGVRTVQRWEAHEGLPVHRHQHQARGTVFAYASEINHWLKSREEAKTSDKLGASQEPATGNTSHGFGVMEMPLHMRVPRYPKLPAEELAREDVAAWLQAREMLERLRENGLSLWVNPSGLSHSPLSDVDLACVCMAARLRAEKARGSFKPIARLV